MVLWKLGGTSHPHEPASEDGFHLVTHLPIPLFHPYTHYLTTHSLNPSLSFQARHVLSPHYLHCHPLSLPYIFQFNPYTHSPASTLHHSFKPNTCYPNTRSHPLAILYPFTIEFEFILTPITSLVDQQASPKPWSDFTDELQWSWTLSTWQRLFSWKGSWEAARGHNYYIV